ncbi:MAG: helix-turn-helix domain-containing protein [Bacteroidales bacterium]|nr:helix-turn-helix domain-containing protein [Bacteroidales bacterium]MCF8458564.1 helix-turn-helix domain-containing protein [Bacteroidales bacterium]
MEANNLSFVYLNKEELSKVVREAISEVIGQMGPSNQESNSIGEFVSLKEAMKILGRKTTWFHNKRESGELPATKSGNQWWYQKEDILRFIKNGKESC